MNLRRETLVVLCWFSLVEWRGVKWEVVEVNGLLTGVAAAGPALEQWLEQEDRLRESQAGRW